MTRIADRLRLGQPLRVGELAGAVGYSSRYLQKLMTAGTLPFVQRCPGSERRIPCADAVALAESLGLDLK